MKTLDKVGITQGRDCWDKSKCEMLEALIMLKVSCDKEWPSVFRNITRDIIQKATGKTWQKIKELINE